MSFLSVSFCHSEHLPDLPPLVRLTKGLQFLGLQGQGGVVKILPRMRGTPPGNCICHEAGLRLQQPNHEEACVRSVALFSLWSNLALT